MDIFEEYLKSLSVPIGDSVMHELGKENIDSAIFKMEEYIGKAYKISKIKRHNNLNDENEKMKMANENFIKLKECINDEMNDEIND